MKTKILKTIYSLLILFVILIAVIPTLSVLDIPLPFRLFAVQTGSMKPTINVGDLILVKEETNYKEGDIITYMSGTGESRTTITHRIDSINEDGTFTTKGDANSAVDVDPLSKKDIIGKYFFKIPFIGYPMNFVKTPLGFILLIVIPATVIGYEEIGKIKKVILSKRKSQE